MNFYSQISHDLLIIGHSKTSHKLKLKLTLDDSNSNFNFNFNSNSATSTVSLNPFQIHSDLLAIICLLAFTIEPNSEIIFPQAISYELSEVLAETPFNLKVLSINPNLKTYKHSTERKFGIAFSGGYDSLAVMTLLKKQTNSVYVYHAGLDTFKRDQPLIELGRKLLPKNFHFVRSNARNLNNLGWSNWPAVLIPLLVMTSKHHWSHLGLGGNIGSVYLKSGEYRSSHTKHGIWYRIFQTIGLPLFCPLAGVSEVGVVKILLSESVLLTEAIYCQKIKGRNCQKCPKCLRRQVVCQLVMRKSKKIDHFPGKSKKNAELKSNKFAELKSKKFVELEDSNISAPSLDWLLSNNPKLAWVNKYYPTALEFQPVELRSLIKIALDKYLDPMTESEISDLESYKN